MKKLFIAFVSVVFFSSVEAMNFTLLDEHVRFGTLTLNLIPSIAELKEADNKQHLKNLVLTYRRSIDCYILSTLVQGADAKKARLENALVSAALASLVGLDTIESSSTYNEAQNKLSSTLYNVELADDSTYEDTSHTNISNLSVTDVEFILDDSSLDIIINDLDDFSSKEDRLSPDNKFFVSISSLSITFLVATVVTYALYVKYRREEYSLSVC